MNLTPSITAIKNAVPFGTVELTDDKNGIQPKGDRNTGIAWIRGAFNEKSRNNNEVIKQQFRQEMSKSFKNFGMGSLAAIRVWDKIDRKIGLDKAGPLTVKTAKAAIRLAEKSRLTEALASSTLSRGQAVKLRIFRFFRPILKLLNVKPKATWLDGSLKGTEAVVRPTRTESGVKATTGEGQVGNEMDVSKTPMEKQAQLRPKLDQLMQNSLQAMRGIPLLSEAPANSPTRANNPTDQDLADTIGIALGTHNVGQEVPVLDKSGQQVMENGMPKMRQVKSSLTAIVNLPRMIWSSETALPSSQIKVLANHPSVSGAIGKSTFINGLSGQTVPDNTPEERNQAALQLKEFIKTLSRVQQQELQTRVGFMKELASLNLERIGPSSGGDAKRTPSEQLRTWQKSVCVSSCDYMGIDVSKSVTLLGVSTKESIQKINDFVLALVMHHDLIFDVQPEPVTGQVETPPTPQSGGVDNNQGIGLDGPIVEWHNFTEQHKRGVCEGATIRWLNLMAEGETESAYGLEPTDCDAIQTQMENGHSTFATILAETMQVTGGYFSVEQPIERRALKGEHRVNQDALAGQLENLAPGEFCYLQCSDGMDNHAMVVYRDADTLHFFDPNKGMWNAPATNEGRSTIQRLIVKSSEPFGTVGSIKGRTGPSTETGGGGTRVGDDQPSVKKREKTDKSNKKDEVNNDDGVNESDESDESDEVDEIVELGTELRQIEVQAHHKLAILSRHGVNIFGMNEKDIANAFHQLELNNQIKPRDMADLLDWNNVARPGGLIGVEDIYYSRLDTSPN